MNQQKIELLREAWLGADLEGRRWLKVVQTEKDNTKNMIATIRMNAMTMVKKQLQKEIDEES